MWNLLWQIWLYVGYFLTVAASGFFLYRLCTPFVLLRRGRLWKVLLFLTLAGTSGMVIWIGDPNLLYTLPIFFSLFFLSTRGNRVGRLAVCIILFCLEMSVCALLDTYVERINRDALYDVLVRMARPLVFGPLWLLLRRRLPREPVTLSRRLWKLVLGLAAMPLCALIAVVLLTFRRYESAEVHAVAMNQGMVVLPFALLTSLVLLLAILILADHERLEQADRLAGLREVYYQGLRQQERQVRQLRHDLRNHLTVVRGLLEKGDAQGAAAWSLPPRRRPWSAQASRWTSPCPSPGSCRWRTRTWRPCWATPWTTPWRAWRVRRKKESPSGAGRTRAFSCCGWRIPRAPGSPRTSPPPRRTGPPTASASRGCGRSRSGTAAPWTRA